jgi:signal transduction histidine kinase
MNQQVSTKPRILRTATFRLTMLYLLFFAVSVCVLAGLFYFTVRSALDSEIRAQITTETNLLMFEYREDGLEELVEETEERIEKSPVGARLQYLIKSPSGKVIFDDIPESVSTHDWQVVDGDIPRLFKFTELRSGYVLGVGKDLVGLQSAQRALTRTVGWILAAALVMGLIGGLILSRRTLAKLRNITHTAREVGEGRLSQRITSASTGDELDELAQTLNNMLDRIENLMSSVRHVSTGIAHDLRTPLARLRNRLESLREAAVSPEQRSGLQLAINETDSILETFAAMLQLAEVESGTLKERLKPLNLSAVVRQLGEAYTPLAEESGVNLEVTAVEEVMVRGDAGLLQQLLANLLENALQHAGKNSDVHLSVSYGDKGACLQVADNGPGIPEAERIRVLRPFERLGDGTGNSGFGLALVAAIARLHDADLQLLDNQPGLKCLLIFPVSMDQPA